MVYNPPDLATLSDSVARDLRDESYKAFSLTEVHDYINAGISELNEVRPIEATVTIIDLANLDHLGLEYIYKVESRSLINLGQNIIPPNNDESNYPNGWSYFGGNLILPSAMLSVYATGFEDGSLEIVVYGYRHRELLLLDAQVAEFMVDYEELAARQFAKWKGLEALEGDRQLFQQWQTAANNSDVSPTQLANMEQLAESEWSRTRRRIYTIRRPAVGW